MRRHRPRSEHIRDASKMIQPSPPGRDDQAPSRWERVEIWLEFGGFAVLSASGLIASAWGAVRYVAGWS